MTASVYASNWIAFKYYKFSPCQSLRSFSSLPFSRCSLLLELSMLRFLSTSFQARSSKPISMNRSASLVKTRDGDCRLRTMPQQCAAYLRLSRILKESPILQQSWNQFFLSQVSNRKQSIASLCRLRRNRLQALSFRLCSLSYPHSCKYESHQNIDRSQLPFIKQA